MRKKLSIISVATLLVCLSFFVVKEASAKTLTIGTATDNILIPGELCFGVDTNCKASWSEIIEAGSQWLKNGTSLYYNSGNVGIGTNNPTQKLEVNGLIKSKNGTMASYLQSVSTNWGYYVNTNISGYGSSIVSVQASGSNSMWNGTFLVQGSSSYSPNENWDNVKLLSWQGYNAGVDDVQLLIMSNTAKTGYGTTILALKTNPIAAGGAVTVSTTVVGANADQINLLASASAPYTYIIASSTNTYQIYQTSSGNVGIGDAAPTNKLTVIGDIYGTGALKITNSSANNWISGNLGVGNATQGGSKLSINGNASIGSGYFSSSATPANGLIVQGNVGIGTTAPGVKLDVTGAIRTNNQLISTVANGTAPLAVSSNTVVANLNADYLDGQHGAYYNHRVYNDAGNYLGAGYISGGAEKPNWTGFGAGKLKLQMLSGSNTGAPDGWNDVLWMSAYTGSDVKNSNALIFGKGGTDRIGFVRQAYDATAWGTYREIYHTGNSNTSGVDWNARDLTVHGGDLIINSNNGGITFNDASAYWLKTSTNWGIYWDTAANQIKFNGSGTTRSFIDLDDGAAYFNGNVGIGTTAPSQKLDVAGYTKATGFCIGASCITAWPSLTEADAIIGNEVTNVTNSTLTRSGSGTAASPYTLALNLANANTWTGAQTMSANTNFPGSGIWNTSGNVGIGTTNPGRRLTIQAGHGDTQFLMHSTGGGTAATEADLMFWASEPGATYSGVGIANNVYNTTSFPRINTARGGSFIRLLDNAISFNTATSAGVNTTAMYINGGNVGIGKTNPGTALDVNGSITTTGLCFGTNCKTSWDAVGSLWSGTRNSNIWNGDSGVGNVGIGTTDPGVYKLSVNNGAVTQYPLNLVSANKYIRIGALNASWAHIDTDASDGVYFYDAVSIGSGNSYLNISSGNSWIAKNGGNVGIGTAAPSDKLSVVGNISGTGLEITSNDTNFITGNNLTVGNGGGGGSKLSVLGNVAIGSTYYGYAAPSDGLIVQGNVGIGTSNPGSYKLNVGGNIYGSNNLILNGGLSDSASNRITNPGGGTYVTTSSSITGAWKIKLPTAKRDSSTMLRFTVKIYEYSTGKSRTIEVGGYNYSSGIWQNVFAYQTSEDGGNLNIRYGYDGTSDVVWIGDTNSTWSYPQVSVTDVQLGFNNYDSTWASGWSIAPVTSFDTVEVGPKVIARAWNQNNDGSGSGLDADLLDGHDTSYFQTAIVNPVTGSGSSGYLPKFTGTSAIGNSNVYTNGTNVGIGTTAPGQKLDVAGSIRTSSQLISTMANGTAPLVVNSTTKINNLNADLFDTLDSSRFIYGSGVHGSNSASATQNVYELAQYKSGFWEVNRAAWAPSNNEWYWGATFAHTSNSASYNYSGQLVFRNGAGGNGVYARTISNGTPTSWSRLLSNTSNVESSGNLNITGSGSHYISNGSVGIGTTAPGYALDVEVAQSSSERIAYFKNTSSGKHTGVAIDSLANQDAYLDLKNNGTSMWDFRADYGTGQLQIREQTDNIERLVIASGGNVGIGATTPGAKLHVANTGANNAAIFVNTSATQAVGNTAELVFGVGSGFVYTNGPRVYAYQEATSGSVTGLRFDTYNSGRATRMTIKGDGKVGIGLTTPSEALEVNGNIKATQYIYNSSDRALKTNIATINNPLDKIMKLRGVTFDWKKDGSSSVGLIAQEVAKVYPELVTGEEGNKSVAYSNLVAPLIEAVKAQQKEIQALNARINKLELELYKR